MSWKYPLFAGGEDKDGVDGEEGQVRISSPWLMKTMRRRQLSWRDQCIGPQFSLLLCAPMAPLPQSARHRIRNQNDRHCWGRQNWDRNPGHPSRLHHRPRHPSWRGETCVRGLTHLPFLIPGPIRQSQAFGSEQDASKAWTFYSIVIAASQRMSFHGFQCFNQ